MKKILSILPVSALALLLPVSGFAAEKKAKATPAPEAAAPADGAKKPAAKPGEPKPIPMYSRADAIDKKAKTFTTTKKDGTEVKHVVTDATEIKNGEAPAKFADIKVGDTVSGLRLKKSPTEYEVVKITKFGVAPPREKKADAEKKAATEKKE